MISRSHFQFMHIHFRFRWCWSVANWADCGGTFGCPDSIKVGHAMGFFCSIIMWIIEVHCIQIINSWRISTFSICWMFLFSPQNSFILASKRWSNAQNHHHLYLFPFKLAPINRKRRWPPAQPNLPNRVRRRVLSQVGRRKTNLKNDTKFRSDFWSKVLVFERNLFKRNPNSTFQRKQCSKFWFRSKTLQVYDALTTKQATPSIPLEISKIRYDII